MQCRIATDFSHLLSYSIVNFNNCVRPLHTTTNKYSKDYYRTLNIAKNASDKEIKSAYFQLAKKYHPDANPGDKDAANKFQEVSEAYEVLGKRNRKSEYDMFGSQRKGQNYQNPNQQWTYHHKTVNNKEAAEMFQKLMKEFSSQQFSQKNTKKGPINFVLSKAFEGLGNKLIKDMMKSSNNFDMKMGPNGLEFVKKKGK